jgi:hypothetical protein
LVLRRALKLQITIYPSNNHTPRYQNTHLELPLVLRIQANCQTARHAPMVAIGKKAIDFVVVQFANGVDIEDCQEVDIEKRQDGLMVAVPEAGQHRGLWKL